MVREVARQPEPPKTIALLGFDGVSSFDLTGPIEALKIAGCNGERGRWSSYRTVVVGLTNKSFTSDSGLLFKAELTIDATGSFDTILIPGGRGWQEPETRRRAAAWLLRQSKSARRIASVGTGLYALAQSGLVNGRLVTTHWRFSRDLARLFPSLRMNPAASFLQDDRFYSSSSTAAGIEMTIHLIKEDYGAELALTVAREMGVDLRPPGDNEPLVEQMNYAPGPADRVAALPVWIASHLTHDLSVEVLAERSALCRRHFTRLFQRIFNHSPADFVEQMRLSEARRRLLMPHHSVESTGRSVGYKSPDAFRRAFERRFGLTPNRYRSRFCFRVTNAPAVRGAARAHLDAGRRVRSA